MIAEKRREERKERGGEKGKNWENFCEQKFSQTLSKNFDWSLAVWARRGTKTLRGE